jgi:hypothetical protein
MWVEPANVVTQPARVRHSAELTRPKLKIAGQARQSTSGDNRSPMLYAAALVLLAFGIAAALYARHRSAGENASPPAHALTRHPPPGAEQASPAASSATTPANQGSGVAGVTATSGPSAGEVPIATTADRAIPQPPVAPPPAPAIPTHVQMSPYPSYPQPLATHRTRPGDAALTLPSINLDAATREIDSSVKARHSP